MASNKCHPNNEPSADCIMNAVNEVGLVMFPAAGPDGEDNKETHAYKISSMSAVPNLVSPYRREVVASIERYDGWAYTSLIVSLENWLLWHRRLVAEVMILTPDINLIRNSTARRPFVV